MVASPRASSRIVASGEVDALMLEYNLIQRHRPRFNIRYRVTTRATRTSCSPWRGVAEAGAPGRQAEEGALLGRAGAWAIRDTLDALTRVFPVRTCSNAFFDQRARAKRPCLYFDIGRCSGPCVPEVSGVTHESYRADVDALADFLAGNTKPVTQRLDSEMQAAAERQEYEQAAKLRDQLGAARRALEAQEMVLDRPESIDVIGMADDDLEAAFQVFMVRGGRVLGRKGWVVDRVEELSREASSHRSSASSTWSVRKCCHGCSCRRNRPIARCSKHGWGSGVARRSRSAWPSGARSAACMRW